MKRLGIFIITELNGIVDDYIMFFLSELKKVLDDLIIACISSSDFKESILREYTKSICYLSDSTTYGQAYREILLKCIKNGVLLNYDEVVLISDILFGPFFPLKDVYFYE